MKRFAILVVSLTTTVMFNFTASAQAFAHGSAPEGFWHMAGDSMMVSVPIAIVLALVAFFQVNERSTFLSGLVVVQLLMAVVAILNFGNFAIFMVAGFAALSCALMLLYFSAKAGKLRTSRRSLLRE